MCSPVTCRRCKKTTWSGCGQHVKHVMAGIPKSQQCDCANNPPAPKEKSGGMFSKIFGR